MIAQLIEFSPAIAEWIGAKKARKILSGMTLAAVIFGITLSTLHQSGLGALYLMAKEKIHPLWYSEFIPILFFVSSIFAGLSMVIFEGSISQKVFFNQISEKNHKAHDGILHGLSKICAFTLLVYFFMQIVVFVHGKHWEYLNSRMGLWYLTEMFGFVVLPMILYFYSYRNTNINLIKVSALVTMIGSDHQQAQCNCDRFQMGCRHSLCPFLDGDCGYPHCPLHRDMDLQMGRETPASTEGIPFLGKRTLTYKLLNLNKIWINLFIQDIFDTKGIEYIVVIGFLLLIIPFWMILNKPLKLKE